MKSQKKVLKLEKKIEKARLKDLERYGIKYDDVGKNSLSKKQKNKKGWKALARCLVYFKSHRFGLGFVVFLSIIYSTISLLDAMFVERMITYIGFLDINNSIKYAIIIAVLMLFTPIIIWGWAIIMTKIIQKVIKNLRIDLIDCVSRTKASKFD